MGLTVRSLTSRLLDSAPEAGSGLNEWLAKGARMTSDLEPYKSFDMLAEIVQAKGGRRDDRAIWRAINKIRGTGYNGPSKPKWPEPNLELIEELTLLRAWDVPGALDTLERQSPDTLKTPDFCGDSLQAIHAGQLHRDRILSRLYAGQ